MVWFLGSASILAVYMDPLGTFDCFGYVPTGLPDLKVFFWAGQRNSATLRIAWVVFGSLRGHLQRIHGGLRGEQRVAARSPTDGGPAIARPTAGHRSWGLNYSQYRVPHIYRKKIFEPCLLWLWRPSCLIIWYLDPPATRILGT